MKAGATGFRRKAGEVVYIRVNPKDCLGVLDLMKKTGVSIRDKSFPQMVSLALSSALEAMRMQGIIPAEPDMFQYSNRMKHYAGRGRKSTGSIAQQIQMGSIETATAVASGTHPVQGIEEETPVDVQAKYQPTAEQRRAVTRMQELEIKREHAPDTWTTRDEEEYKECERVAFG